LENSIVSTDPPYYDNIGYADLSDFFYVWLRRSLRSVFPDLFAPIAVPKAEELIASPYRHGGRAEAEAFFLEGMTRAMTRLAEQAHPAVPVTIYYAFKASETKESGTTSTGWETFLEAVLKAGFAITGTWPMRTERAERMVGKGTNALASSIVLVCRRRDPDAPSVSRREFLRELSATLPEALADMVGGGEHSPVAPVDLSQAVIGPGMAIFSKYSSVLEADGQAMSVKTALQLINRFFADEDFEADTWFCLHWFDQYGWAEGPFGQADVLARAKGTSVEGVAEAGVVEACQGQVRLLRVAEYPVDWDPAQDGRIPVWEALHHLLRALKHGGGERPAATLLAHPKLMVRLDGLRQLAYRLYTWCERKGQAEDARAYNELIAAWPSIEARARKAAPGGQQGELEY
jgi:putative DNA methylase